MPGINIGWDNTTPADSESMSLGDDRIRSLKSNLQGALDAEHIFSTSGGAGTGAHRPGSAVAFYGVQSNVSSSDTFGRLMVTSDTSRLFAVGSNGTVLIGGTNVISAGSFPGAAAPQRHHWVEEFGDAITTGGAVTISIPNSGYSGLPYVWLSAYTRGTGIGARDVWIMTQRIIDSTSFTVASYDTGGQNKSNVSFFWRSLGSRVL